MVLRKPANASNRLTTVPPWNLFWWKNAISGLGWPNRAQFGPIGGGRVRLTAQLPYVSR